MLAWVWVHGARAILGINIIPATATAEVSFGSGGVRGSARVGYQRVRVQFRTEYHLNIHASVEGNTGTAEEKEKEKEKHQEAGHEP